MLSENKVNIEDDEVGKVLLRYLSNIDRIKRDGGLVTESSPFTKEQWDEFMNDVQEEDDVMVEAQIVKLVKQILKPLDLRKSESESEHDNPFNNNHVSYKYSRGSYANSTRFYR